MSVSVIMPIKNGMPFLQDSVRSIINQTYTDWKLIAILNGSTDDSYKYLKSIKDSRIIIYDLEDIGLIKALNFGLTKVVTEFVARMDADDISHPNRFEKQVEFLRYNRNISLVGTLGKYFGSIKNKNIIINVPLTHNSILNSMLNCRMAIIHASIMFRNGIVKNYSNEYSSCEDFELFLRISNEVKFANLKDYLYYIRVSDSSIISRNLTKSMEQYYNITNSIYSISHNKIYKLIDIYSLIIYRKGLRLYLNNNPLLGLLFFMFASIVNPYRLINNLYRKINH